MISDIFLDIETYSSVDLSKSGVYKYCESLDFEILLFAYAVKINGKIGPVKVIDLTINDLSEVEHILIDPKVKKHAHNATFERIALRASGIDIPANEWYCSMVKAAYCGLPLSLDILSTVLNLSNAKDKKGKDLIRLFSVPVKPTKTNGFRERNLPHHAPEKWGEFKAYVKMDVLAEIELLQRLSIYKIPESERLAYVCDQEMNDKGIMVDLKLVESALYLDSIAEKVNRKKFTDITGIENPKSNKQVAAWISENTGKEVTTVNKESLSELLSEITDPVVLEAISLKQELAKTSIRKYDAMARGACSDGRLRGLLQFYGANRTGRWAGRFVQVQNLPKNFQKPIDEARNFILNRDFAMLELVYGNVPRILSECLRTTFIAPKGRTFVVPDFNAIEARVLAWVAGEQWRIDVFNSHGLIYEASAAKIFKLKTIEEVTKAQRGIGKILELAMGYGGGIGALMNFGGSKIWNTEREMKDMISVWRGENPSITTLWNALNDAAVRAVITKKPVKLSRFKNIVFDCDENALTIELPSGRKLFYWNPVIREGRFGGATVAYKGLDQNTKQWGWISTYGGKLTENIIQAISRDVLSLSLLNLSFSGYEPLTSIHDEILIEEDETEAKKSMVKIEEIMNSPPPWGLDLAMKAVGFINPYYMKEEE